MGWANCGYDSNGRPIGYAFEATCDHPGCKAKIDRGVSYACGNMHGELDHACEGYFCGDHLSGTLPIDGKERGVCQACYEQWKKYAIENPDDADELIEFFDEWEGPEWRSPSSTDLPEAG